MYYASGPTDGAVLMPAAFTCQNLVCLTLAATKRPPRLSHAGDDSGIEGTRRAALRPLGARLCHPNAREAL